MGEPISLSASDVVFAEATPEQRRLTWGLNGVSWAAPLSLDDYVAREAHLSEQELTRDGRCKYWVLYLKGYPSQIIASCESTRKPVLISEKGSCREGWGYGIASVYTNATYRRQGMAAYLLKKVQAYIDIDSNDTNDSNDNDGHSGGDCSVLYSDIGRSYYASLGWAVFPSDQATLQLLPLPSTAPPGTFRSSRPGRIRYLSADELAPLCVADELAVRARFRSLPDDGKTHVAFVPSHAQIRWQLARAAFVTEKMHGRPAARCGAVIVGDTNSQPESQSWIAWDHDWRQKKLKVLRLVTPTNIPVERRVDNVRVLLEAALEEAGSWGISKVLVWNPDEILTRGCKTVGNVHEEAVKVVFGERADGSLPSFRWKGGKSSKGTVWEENFYYCWC